MHKFIMQIKRNNFILALASIISKNYPTKELIYYD